MPTLPAGTEVALLANRAVHRTARFGAPEQTGFDPRAAAQARQALTHWRGYSVTPLVELPELARQLGVAHVYAKYEGARTELLSFKALGGAYALSVVLAERLVELGHARQVTAEELESGPYRTQTATLTAVCASDGNHGRSVAWGAHRFGCQCVVYLPRAVSAYREQAIARFGARVVRVNGNYDDAVRQAAEDAARNGWLVISDTSSSDYQAVPRLVMAGYSLAIDEALRQIGEPNQLTHVFVQAGCGAFAAVVAGYLWAARGESRPCLTSVEPQNAACVLASVSAGEPVVVGGEHSTTMGGLACGEVSFLAWQVLHRGLDFACAIADVYAAEAMNSLADGRLGAKLAAAETGAAGVGALIALARHPELKQHLGLAPDSRVLVFITEGVTDPTAYPARPVAHERSA